jgi:hypothetical protein
MPEVSPASAFLLVVSFFSPASPFRHQGSFRYRWSQISLAWSSYYFFQPNLSYTVGCSVDFAPQYQKMYLLEDVCLNLRIVRKHVYN